MDQEVQVPVFHERASYQRKDETCRFNGRSILLEAKKLQELSVEKLKIKIEIEQRKSRVKIMEEVEQIFGEMKIRKI